jgi:glucose/arabinose dehydrogenase
VRRQPDDFVNKGAGRWRAPFGLAFNNGYLYVGNTGSLVRFKYAAGIRRRRANPRS